VKELDAHVLKYVKDANGNHISRLSVFRLLVNGLLSGHPKGDRASVTRVSRICEQFQRQRL
jgi:hypothetical protein